MGILSVRYLAYAGQSAEHHKAHSGLFTYVDDVYTLNILRQSCLERNCDQKNDLCACHGLLDSFLVAAQVGRDDLGTEFGERTSRFGVDVASNCARHEGAIFEESVYHRGALLTCSSKNGGDTGGHLEETGVVVRYALDRPLVVRRRASGAIAVPTRVSSAEAIHVRLEVGVVSMVTFRLKLFLPLGYPEPTMHRHQSCLVT